MPSNKLSAMLIIFITASPLASLIRIFMLLYNYFFTSTASSSTTTITDHDMDGDQNPLLHSTLPGVLLDYFTNNNGNVTIDDIMKSILNHQPFHPYYPTKNNIIHPFHPFITFVAKDKLNQDIQMVIPWIFAFTTLIIIPLIMIVCNALWRRNEMESNFRKKRIDVYRRCLVDFQKKVDDCDIVTYNDPNYDNNESNYNDYDKNDDVQKKQMQEDNTFIVIPKPGVSIHQKNDYPDTHKQYREVPATCAICLSCYTKGETIVWSSYVECSHAFHLSCIDTWIKKRYATSCPCCRRNFIDSEIYAKIKYSRFN